MVRACALVAVVLAACASHPPPPAKAAPAPAPASASAPLTEDDCNQLIDHVLHVALAERATQPTDDQIAAARTKLSADMMKQCLAWDRASFTCAMAAQDRASMNTCAGAH